MKIQALFLVYFFAVSQVYAQNVQGRILYRFYKHGDKLNTVLYFNDSSSMYISNKLGMDTSVASLAGMEASSLAGIAIKDSEHDSVGAIVYRNYSQKTIKFRHVRKMAFAPFTIDDRWVNIDWRLAKGEKKILGYNCKKAVGFFRGRNYIAWYSPDIPKPYGPWKLFGLPGMILEARDKERKFHFEAMQIDFNDSTVIAEPVENINKSIEEYVYHIDNDMYLMLEKLRERLVGFQVEIIETTSKEDFRNANIEKIFEWELDGNKAKHTNKVNRQTGM
jgi:GLPGLI family protein